MPNIIKQPKHKGQVPDLNDATTARKKLRVGTNKWNELQHEIDHVLIGRRKFWTDQALADFVRRQTRKAKVLCDKPARDPRIGHNRGPELEDDTPSAPRRPAKPRRRASGRPEPRAVGAP